MCRSGSVATVVLSRPPLNILDLEMTEALDSELGRTAEDEAVRVVVLRSGVGGVFSAGADVKEHLPASAERLIGSFEKLASRLVSMPVPTVALVEGKCLGGGMEVALACDFVIASETASFGQPEINVGVYPPVAAAIYPRIAGLKSTFRVLLTGKTFSANDALAMGFVTEVARADEIDERLNELVSSLTAKSRVVLELTKRAVMENLAKPLPQALRDSSRLYLDELMKTEDAKEGLTAFIEKRAPSWKDR